MRPVLLNFTGPDEIYAEEMEPLCRAAKALDIPLEINMHGLVLDRNYPSERFFRLAGSCGNTIVTGLDAHSVDGIFQPDTLENYRALIARCGLTVTDRISLRDPFRKP